MSDEGPTTIEGEYEDVSAESSSETELLPQEIASFVDWVEAPFDEVGQPSAEAIELASTLDDSNLPKQVGTGIRFNKKLSKVEPWVVSGFRSPSNAKADSKDVVEAVLNNLYGKMVDIGLSKSLRELNSNVVNASDIEKVDGYLEAFKTDKKEEILLFEANALQLRNHVHDTFQANKMRRDGKTKVTLGHDLTSEQKNELLLFLDRAIDMANDLKKGSASRNAQEIHENFKRLETRRATKEQLGSEKSLTGMSYAYEFATNAEISSNANHYFPGTEKVIFREWRERATRAIDELCYTDLQSGTPITYNEIPNNLEALWQNKVLAGTQRKADGSLVMDFSEAGVQEHHIFAGRLAVPIRAGMGNETISTINQMIRVTGDDNKAVLPTTGDFDDGFAKLILNGTLKKNEYNRFYIKKARDRNEHFEINVSGAEDLASHIFPNTRAHFFGVNRKNTHHIEALHYKWDYLTRFPNDKKHSLPGKNTFNPMIRHLFLKKPLAYALGAYEAKPGVSVEFGIDTPSYSVKKTDKKANFSKEVIELSRAKYTFMAPYGEDKKESPIAPVRRTLVRWGPVVAAAAVPGVPLLVAAAPLFISDIGGINANGKRVPIRFTPLGRPIAKAGAVVGAIGLAASLALNGVPNVEFGNVYKDSSIEFRMPGSGEKDNSASSSFNKKTLQQHDQESILNNDSLQKGTGGSNKTLREHDAEQIENNPEIQDDIKNSSEAQKFKLSQSSAITAPSSGAKEVSSDKVFIDFENATFAVIKDDESLDYPHADDQDITSEHDIA